MKSLISLPALFLLDPISALSSNTPLVRQDLDLVNGDDNGEVETDDGAAGDSTAEPIDDCRVHGCSVDGECCGLAYVDMEELFGDGVEFICANPEETILQGEGLPD